MSKIGTYRNKNVYDYSTITAAINASSDNDIFTVYWISGTVGRMFWKGNSIASVNSDRKGLHVVNFNEELWKPKKKEEPVAPTYVKEVSVTSGTKKEETEVPLYDADWYRKIMDELDEQWSKMRPNNQI